MSGFKIEKELGLEWATVLYDFLESDYYNHLQNFIDQIYLSGKEVYPKQSRLFNCFKDTNYEDVKVVVIDNRPVKDLRSSGVGRGIDSLSTLNSDLPIELREFRDCIYNTVYGNQMSLTNFDNSLYEYSDNGFLFLNVSMCVEKNVDYTLVWKNFIRYVLKELSSKKNLVYLFLTDDNLDLCKYINKDNNEIIINTSRKININSEIFLESNEYIYDNYKNEAFNLW